MTTTTTTEGQFDNCILNCGTNAIEFNGADVVITLVNGTEIRGEQLLIDNGAEISGSFGVYADIGLGSTTTCFIGASDSNISFYSTLTTTWEYITGKGEWQFYKSNDISAIDVDSEIDAIVIMRRGVNVVLPAAMTSSTTVSYAGPGGGAMGSFNFQF
jgi:hypothetical protein